MNCRAAIPAALLVLLGAGRLRAQEPRQLEVTVTSVSGRNVFLDRGRSDGLVPGTLVRLMPAGEPEVEVTVRASTSSSARCELPAGARALPIGTRGMATVNPAGAAGEKQPDHPDWQRQDPARKPDDPLLVPAYGRKPSQRPATVSGRVYGFGQWNRDNQQSNDYLLGRLGGAYEMTNPIGRGGRFVAEGEVDQRSTEVEGETIEDTTRGRIDLFSYAEGDEEWAPFGWEAGRMYSAALPELGLLDGAEGIVRFDNGMRIGAAAGAYPLPYVNSDWGADYGFHLFTDFGADREGPVAGTVGIQKTWHEGEADRDLGILRVEGRPGGDVWYYASAKLDLYTSDDTIKGSGIELTEFLGQLRKDGREFGVGALFSHFTWPELLRDEYLWQDDPVTPSPVPGPFNDPWNLVEDGYVDRLGADAWWRSTDVVRWTARIDQWTDQESDGLSGELGVDHSNFLDTGTFANLTLVWTDGEYTDGPGARFRLRRSFGAVAVSVGASLLSFEYFDLASGESSYVRQTWFAQLDFTVGDFDGSLTVEQWFGDEEDATAIGIFGQQRF